MGIQPISSVPGIRANHLSSFSKTTSNSCKLVSLLLSLHTCPAGNEMYGNPWILEEPAVKVATLNARKIGVRCGVSGDLVASSIEAIRLR